MGFLFAALGVGVFYVLSSLRVLNQYERGVMFFLGRHTGTRGPGLIFVPLVLSKMRRVSMRVVAMDIPAQDVITRDNISVQVNAVLYFRVVDPSLAILEIQDYL
ncbi:MAG TPA: SPFH domain-containing protein, partial [Gemmatimonadaceae bacterium]